MQIGLIGGIGPAATDFYYRSLIEKFASEDADLDMTIVHAEASTLVKNLMDDNKDAQVNIYSGLTKRLKNAGAVCVAITPIAGLFASSSKLFQGANWVPKITRGTNDYTHCSHLI